MKLSWFFSICLNCKVNKHIHTHTHTFAFTILNLLFLLILPFSRGWVVKLLSVCKKYSTIFNDSQPSRPSEPFYDQRVTGSSRSLDSDCIIFIWSTFHEYLICVCSVLINHFSAILTQVLLLFHILQPFNKRSFPLFFLWRKEIKNFLLCDEQWVVSQVFSKN